MNFLKVSLFFLLPLLGRGQYYEKIFHGQHGPAFAREDSVGNIIVSFPDDSTIVKYDSMLTVIWSKQYDFKISTFEILGNGNLICGGKKTINALNHAFIGMLNPNGDTIWTKVYQPNNPISNSSVYMMQIDGNDDYIFAISEGNNSSDPNKFVKMNANGDSMRSVSFLDGREFHFKIYPDNYIIAVHSTWIPYTVVVTGYDSVFNSQILDTFKVAPLGIPHSFSQPTVFPGPQVKFAIRYDADTYIMDIGSIYFSQWKWLLSGEIIDIIIDTNGGFLCLGNFNGTGIALKLDLNYNSEWSSVFVGIEYVTPLTIQQVRDGGFLISGYTDSSTFKIPWIYKMNSSGVIPTTSVNDISISIYQLKISHFNQVLNISQQGGNKVVISDLLGKEIRTICNVSEKFNSELMLLPGIYLATLYRNNTVLDSKKFVVQN